VVEVDQVMALKLQGLVVVVVHKVMMVEALLEPQVLQVAVEVELVQQEQSQLMVLQELPEALVVMVYQIILQEVVLHMLEVVEVAVIQLHLEHQVDQVVVELVDLNHLIMQPQELQTLVVAEEELVELQVLVELMVVQE
jgi:hypothetical protein